MYSHKLYVNSLKVILKVYTTNEEHLTNNSMVFRFSLFCAPNSVKMIFSNQIIGVLINFGRPCKGCGNWPKIATFENLTNQKIKIQVK